MPVWFVGTTRGNLFMNELLDALCAEVSALGVDARRVDDRFPPAQLDTAYVVVPHEFFGTVPEEGQPGDEALARTVALSLEQPGTPWFETAFGVAERCGAVFDISAVGMLELRRRGLAPRHLQLGWTAAWDAFDPDAERRLDVAVLGSLNRRRELALSGYVDVLARREGRLLLPPPEPKTEARADYVAGATKRELLAGAKVVLNVRRQAPPYFEWVRALEAICAGAVLVTEHGAGHAPLVPGEHFVSGSPESLAWLADGLLDDPDRLAAMRRAAYDLVRTELPMRAGAERLAEVAVALSTRPVRPTGQAPAPASEEPVPEARDLAWDDPLTEHDAPLFDADAAARRALKRTAIELQAVRRELARREVAERGEDPEAVVEQHRSPAYAAVEPVVSVCIPCYGHADHIEAALRSVARQDFDGPLEVLVLDDASPDASGDVVRAFSAEREWLALALWRRTVNAGLPHARNELLARARGRYVLFLDSDNELLAPCVRRLAEALDGDPGALFAYPILAAHRAGRPDGLLSAWAWRPELLTEINPVDALAMLRRDGLRELGGYATDPELHGWEDWDLWCRCAERGERGVHVPQMLARYRRDASSMLSLTDLDTTDARAALRRRHPGLFSGTLADA